ncbi:hypothetical protein DRN74_04670 [Candidatus Micrarchaeota archaeon]|nr:MAG: hypothetical protein DRN74_04670 [Candidatus Micrarchaeota archaeon]
MGELADRLKEYVAKVQSHELSASEDLRRLTQKAYYNAVVAGAKRREFMRKILPVVKTGSHRVRVFTSNANGYASKGAYKGEPPIFHPKYTSIDVVTEKAWTLPLAPKELVEDAEFDLIENEVSLAGMRLENTLNQDAISTLIDAAPNSVTCDGTSEIAAIEDACVYVSDSQFTPTYLIATPKFYFDLVSWQPSPIIYNKEQGGTLKWEMLAVTSNGDNNWGWKNTGDVGGVVLDAEMAALILMKEDITVKKYSDPLNDLRGAIVEMKYKVVVRKPKAICIIKHD